MHVCTHNTDNAIQVQLKQHLFQEDFLLIEFDPYQLYALLSDSQDRQEKHV